MDKKKIVLVTGSDGLVGSESVKFFSKKGFFVVGIDNNSRKKFLKYDEKPQEGVDFQKQMAAKLSEDLINSDPELDINLHGKFISQNYTIIR